jgi:hypothetical protein
MAEDYMRRIAYERQIQRIASVPHLRRSVFLQSLPGTYLALGPSEHAFADLIDLDEVADGEQGRARIIVKIALA